MFSGQDKHVVDPSSSEYVPASQALHSTDPVFHLYFPGTQALQLSLSALEKPGLQVCEKVQLVACVLPSGEIEPYGQASHQALPLLLL